MEEIDMKPGPKSQASLPPNETDQQSGHFHWKTPSRSHAWRPPTDVYVTDDNIVVRVEIAGMREAEFEISLDNRHLVIWGNRPEHAERRSFHQMEIHFGEFRVEVDLHWAVDSKNIEAEYQDGFLLIVLPKAKPHQVEIGKD